MPQDLRIALVGGAGAVGSEIAELIEHRDFPRARLTRFGAASSTEGDDEEAAEGPEVNSVLATPDELADYDLAFLAIPEAAAAEIVTAAPGPILIDLSAANRPPSPATPLAAPGLTTREGLTSFKDRRVFSIPHPAAQVIASILKALRIRGGFAAGAITQGASAYGRDAITRLFRQSAEVLNARLDLQEDERQTAFNLLQGPDADQLAAVVTAQAATLVESAPDLVVRITTVPAFHGSTVTIFLPRTSDASEWEERLRTAPGIILNESSEALSVVDALGQEAILTRFKLTPSGAAISCAFDAARLAALSAVWLAEVLIS
jgi:aspartate-semialdehyde dehydrogenase